MKKHLILAAAALGCIVLCGCGSSKKMAAEVNREFTDERRDAVVEQVNSVVAMLNVSTKTAQELCEPLKRMIDTLKLAIRYDDFFESNKEYRALSRQLSHKLSVDERGFDPNCFMDLMWIPFLWTVDCHDEVEMMFTTFFRASAESYDRMANVVLAHYDGDKKSAVLVVTNYIDTVINNLSLQFQNSVGRWDELPLEEEMKDYSDVESGIIRVMLPTDELIQRLKWSMVMKVSYKVSDGELIEMVHPILSPEFGAGCSFEEQLKECPRLSKPGKLVR